MTKIYITKYAMTRGILAVTAELIDNGRRAAVRLGNSAFTEYYMKGRDWEETEDLARESFQRIKQAKVVSLTKQLDRTKAKQAQFTQVDGLKN